MASEARQAARAQRRLEEHSRLPALPNYKGTARSGSHTNNNMPPNTKRKRDAEDHQPNKKVKQMPPPPVLASSRPRPQIPGSITMSQLNKLGRVPKKQTSTVPATAPSPYADRAPSSPPKKRKRSDASATEDSSNKKSRQESSDEDEKKPAPSKKMAPKKTATTSKPGASSSSKRWTCELCGVSQASSSNKGRHQKSETCQKRAHERKFGVSKAPPPTKMGGVKAEPEVESESSSPDSKQSASAGKDSRSRNNSTSTKRTSFSSTPEEPTGKGKAKRVETPPTEIEEESEESTPSTIPVGLLNMRGVATSAQNARLQLLYQACTDKDIDLLCAGEEPKMFNLKDEELIKHDNTARGKKKTMFDVKLKEAKQKIMMTALTPREHHESEHKEPSIAIAPYIGRLFKKMREAEKNGEKVEITAMMPQMVFALSGKKFLETMDEEGVDLQTALASRKNLEISEENQEENAGEYLTNLIEALGREHPFILEKFKMKLINFGHCDVDGCDGKHNEYKPSLSLKATVPAVYDIGFMDEDVTSTVIKSSTKEVIQNAIDYHTFDQVDCKEILANGESCSGKMVIKPCISQYPDFLLVQLEREDKENPLRTVDGESIEIGEKNYRMVGMVQRDAVTSHNVALREVEGKWWRLSDEDVEAASKVQLQDGFRGQCDVLLLKKM